LLPFHLGAFVAAAGAGLPVVPLVLRGTRSYCATAHGSRAWGASPSPLARRSRPPIVRPAMMRGKRRWRCATWCVGGFWK